MLLLLWHKKEQTAYLLLASIFAGLATFTKLEATAYLLILFIIFLLLNRQIKFQKRFKRRLNVLIFAAPGLLACFGFHLYKLAYNILRDGTGIADKTKIDFSFDK